MLPSEPSLLEKLWLSFVEFQVLTDTQLLEVLRDKRRDSRIFFVNKLLLTILSTGTGSCVPSEVGCQPGPAIQFEKDPDALTRSNGNRDGSVTSGDRCLFNARRNIGGLVLWRVGSVTALPSPSCPAR